MASFALSAPAGPPQPTAPAALSAGAGALRLQAVRPGSSLAGLLSTSVGAAVAAAAAAGGKRQRRGRGGRARVVARRAAGAQDLHDDDLYVRVTCTAVQFVGTRGAVLGVEQMSKADSDYHFTDLPIAMPVLLGTEEAEEFRQCRRDLEWTDTALCEVRIHAPTSGSAKAELLITEGCTLPTSSDGFLLVDAVKEGEKAVPCSVGEALAMALKLKAPVLLSTRYLLRATRGAMERLRDEQVCAGDEGCDIELEGLIQELGAEDPQREKMGEVLETLKPFAWYWAEHRQGGELETASLGEFMDRYKRECANVYAAAW